MNGPRVVQGGPPRRGSFQEDINTSSAGTTPSKSRTPSLSASYQGYNTNAHKSNQALSTLSGSVDLDNDDDEAMLTDDDPGFTKSSAGSRRQSVASLSGSHSGLGKSISTDDDLIEVKQDAFQLPLDPASKGKLKNRYIMADGSVINGKGLGRGRPGVKRGPRKSALSRELTETSNDAAATISTPSPGPQAKSSAGKRKRKDSDVIKAEDDEDDNDDDEFDDGSRESTPEYAPVAATHTRSGRQSQKPAAIITPATSVASPATKRAAATQSTSSPSIKKHPKIKPKIYRGREQFALCEHCLRQHGPPGNVIVFCDACNKCWHQRCHDPKISKEVVEDTKAEWFCSDCDKILHPKRKNKAMPKLAPQPTPPVAPPPAVPISTPIVAAVMPRYGLPLVPGMSLTFAQKREYLHTVPKERLVEIVLQAANLAPNMPIFETPMHLVPQFLPGQPYPTFMQPPLATQTPPPPQTHAQPQPQHQPRVQPQPQPPPQAQAPQLAQSQEQPQANNHIPLQPTPPPQPTINIASMPPPPPPSQLPAHLRAQFTSSMAAGHMPPQPGSASTSSPSNQQVSSPPKPPPHPQTISKPSSGPPSGPDNRPIYTHPTAGITTKPNSAPPPPSASTGDVADDDEGYFDDYDEMALLYPKPGQGAYNITMAPESTDLGIMLEGDDCVTFSHVVY